MESIEDSLRNTALRSWEVDATSGEIRGEFLFTADFPAFAGHFPGRPVLPAIVQLAAIRVMSSKALDKRFVPLETVRVKFKNMIGPNEKVRVVVKIVSKGERVHMSFTLDGAKGRAASGEIICGVEG
ncbi:MAG: hypothetical protein OEM02_06285 [Desulfobulbaceae bacterium]|nr:hypothetical protein [Desulfobulbaceae bacterium]